MRPGAVWISVTRSPHRRLAMLGDWPNTVEPQQVRALRAVGQLGVRADPLPSQVDRAGVSVVRYAAAVLPVVWPFERSGAERSENSAKPAGLTSKPRKRSTPNSSSALATSSPGISRISFSSSGAQLASPLARAELTHQDHVNPNQMRQAHVTLSSEARTPSRSPA